jgi:queuine tRNA-ribosyltransferase
VRLSFHLEAETANSRARATTFQTLHGTITTPLFMPVGTQATVRAQTLESLETTRAQILLANTYHLLLRPGPEVFELHGGIHSMMGWKGSVLTDSGGYQIFSLPKRVRMTDEGARFQSYVDGSTHVLTPETSIRMQRAIGSDIMMVLDQCIDSTLDRSTAKRAMDLTHAWALRSLRARESSPQSLFAIVQGACFPELRRESARFLTDHPFDGFAIGGLAVGETKTEREDMTELAADLLPKHLPRYLMGVGTPLDLLEAVHRGVDLFDCILPTALAQQGVCFTWQGKVQLRRGAYRLSKLPIDETCECSTCLRFTRAYLHHLIKAKEFLGWHLIGHHNLYFYSQLMSKMRESIFRGDFFSLYQNLRERLGLIDEDDPPVHPTRKKSKPSKESFQTLGDYRVLLPTAECGGRIEQKSSGEVMHSVSDPSVESERLYVEPSRLESRPHSLRVWDVGLGAASNAMALLRKWRKLKSEGILPSTAELEIESFERDLDPLRLALRFPHAFSYLRDRAPFLLLENHEYQEEGVKWRLHLGDFRETSQALTIGRPNLVYYDPFSQKVDQELWSYSHFQKLYSLLAPQARSSLFTYSNSTLIRARLLGAGFFVGRGPGSGPKPETTHAFLDREDPSCQSENLLGLEFLGLFERSGAISTSERLVLRERLERHPQFRS